MSVDTVMLEAGSELRYEVPHTAATGAKVKLVPQSGEFAEMAGAEMAPGLQYDLPPGSTGAVYTWHGCELNLEHLSHDQIYTAQNPAMQHYAQAHSILEKKRRLAKVNMEAGDSYEGPRVLVCGGPSSGKLTLCKTLLNYAARLDWQCTFVDLDVSYNSISLPGTIAAVPVDMPIPIEEGLSVFPPMTLNYGSNNLEEKGEDLYLQLISTLAERVRERTMAQPKSSLGGLVAKAMTSKGSGAEVVHTIKELAIDYVFVLGDDKLHAKLCSAKEREGLECELIQLPRSGGCVPKTEAMRNKARANSIRIYFHGWPHMKLHPNRYEVTDLMNVKIVKVGGTLPGKMEGLLPIGEKSTLTATDVSPVVPSKELENSILAISQATNVDDASTAPVLGFAKVLSIADNSMTLLIPVPVTMLESDIFIAGDIYWFENL